jgi:bifunctional non-homologous end joining protein LigD
MVVRASSEHMRKKRASDANATVRVGKRTVTLTHRDKIFFPKPGITKGDLLDYYRAVAPVLVPHLRGRAMVMKRYPDGAAGPFFFMKRTPSPRPPWLPVCAIAHRSGNVIDFPIVDDAAALLWIVNLGCIDLNPWYSRCDDVDRPDTLSFDLDPTPGATFAQLRSAALVLRDALATLGMPVFVKTSGSRGLHVYVPIKRGPLQKAVWTFAKALAGTLAERSPRLITNIYRVAARPERRVLIDYNQNAWNRTLASVYSVRPTPTATVSTPVTWGEVESGVTPDAFHLADVPVRLREMGDLWKPLLAARGRFDLMRVLA